jgi:POT family proton-dependent oligopeptide transporter
MQALYLLSISGGNLFTALVHWFIQNPDGSLKLHGASYYRFFAWLSIGCVAVFVFIAKAYREKTYIQGDAPVPLADAASET